MVCGWRFPPFELARVGVRSWNSDGASRRADWYGRSVSMYALRSMTCFRCKCLIRKKGCSRGRHLPFTHVLLASNEVDGGSQPLDGRRSKHSRRCAAEAHRQPLHCARRCPSNLSVTLGPSLPEQDGRLGGRLAPSPGVPGFATMAGRRSNMTRLSRGKSKRTIRSKATD